MLPYSTAQGRQSWGAATHRFWAGGSWNIIYYYAQEVCLEVVTWKRNKIICQEVAVNDQFLPGKSKFFVKLPEKIKIFWKFVIKKSNFFTWIYDPQISNKTDAAATAPDHTANSL